jgi:hypothetical protein
LIKKDRDDFQAQYGRSLSVSSVTVDCPPAIVFTSPHIHDQLRNFVIQVQLSLFRFAFHRYLQRFHGVHSGVHHNNLFVLPDEYNGVAGPYAQGFPNILRERDLSIGRDLRAIKNVFHKHAAVRKMKKEACLSCKQDNWLRIARQGYWAYSGHSLSWQYANLKELQFWNGNARGTQLPNEEENIRMSVGSHLFRKRV